MKTLLHARLCLLLVALASWTFVAPDADAGLGGFFKKKAKSAVKSVTKKAKDTAKKATSAVQDTAKKAKDTTKKVVHKAADTAKKVVHKAATTAKKTAHAVKDSAKKVAHKAADTAKKTVHAAKDAGQRALNSAKSAVRATAHWTQERAAAVKAKAVGIAKKTWAAGKKAARKTVRWAQDGVAKVKRRYEQAKAAYAKFKGFVKEHGKDIIGAYNAVKEHLDPKGVAGKKAKVVVERAKEEAKKHLGPMAQKVAGLLKGKLAGLMKLLGKASPHVQRIAAALEDASKILEFIKNPEQLVKAGKAKAVDMLADAAMKALQGPLEKANAYLVGKAMKLMKAPVTTAIAGGVSTAVSGAVASVTAGAGAVLQPLLQPIAKMGADQMVDWGIDKVKGKVGELVFDHTKSLIKDAILKPLIDKGYEKLMGAAKKHAPGAYAKGAKAIKTASQVATKVDKHVDAAKKVTDKFQKFEQDVGKAHKKVSDVEKKLAQ